MSSVVICHTQDCGNADQPISMDLTYEDEYGDTHPVGSVSCGVCGQPITDVDPPLESA